MEKSLDELEEEINKRKQAQDEAYARQKADSETREMANIISDPEKTLNAKLSQKLATSIDNSKEVDLKVEETTNILVDKGLEEQKNKAIAKVTRSEDASLQADFEKYKNEYLYHGISHKIDKKWKKNLILLINDIWFVIWAIVSCFTIVPVSTFLSRISALNGFIKGVALVLGIVMLLACLGGLTYGCLKWTGVVG